MDFSPLRELADRWQNEADRLGFDLKRVGRSLPRPISDSQRRTQKLFDRCRTQIVQVLRVRRGRGRDLWMAVRGVAFPAAVRELMRLWKAREEKWKMQATTRHPPIFLMT